MTCNATFHWVILIGLLLGVGMAKAQSNAAPMDKEAILAMAREALAAQLQPGASLYKAVQKEQLTGNYLLEVSFRDKGRVTSVFVAEASDHDIRSQNRFKELVRQCRLNIKTPKGQQYRVQQRFNLNNLNQ